VNPTDVSIATEYKYGEITAVDCSNCSHLCLVVPGGGARCRCPGVIEGSECGGAPLEPPHPLPPTCTCENAGICNENLLCSCLEGYSGAKCELLINNQEYISAAEASSLGWVIGAILFVLVSLGGAAFYLVLRKRNFVFPGKFMTRESNVVVFSNSGGDQQNVEFTKEYSNPMYDYNDSTTMEASTSSSIPPPTVPIGNIAVLPIVTKHFDAVENDTGKDTQNLVSDSSEC